MQRLSFALLLAALAALALSLAQGNPLRYTAPKGWEETSQDGVKILAPKGLGDDKVFAVLLTPVADLDQGTGRKQLARLLKEIHEGAKVLESSEVQSKTTEGVEIVSQTVVLDAPDIGKHARLYFLIAQGKRYTLAFVMTNDDALIDKYGEAAMDLIGSVKLEGTSKAPSKPASGGGTIPTGDTPDRFPGTPGWLPSGRGVPIPEPTISGGKPVGMWYAVTSSSRGSGKANVLLLLPNGVRATHPRLGGPRLFDLEGQKAQKGVTGVGTYSVASGQIVQRYDRFEAKDPFTTGKDGEGPFFKIGGALYRPLLPFTKATLAGHWRSFGGEYKFAADGTFQYGTSARTGEFAAEVGGGGTYTLDGYLLHLKPSQGPAWIEIVGRAEPMMAMGSTLYVRVR